MTAILLSLACLTYTTEEYSAAREACLKDHQPLCVYVHATWCGPCKTSDKWLASIAERGRLVVLDADHDQATIEATAGGGSIPRLAVYTWKKDNWYRAVYVGATGPGSIHEFVFPEELK